MQSSYIQNLHSYLLSFAKRTSPLVDIQTQQQEVEAEFDKSWEAGEVPGWEESKPKAQLNGNGTAGIWCAACTYFIVLSHGDSFMLVQHKVKNTIRSRQFMTHI